MPRDHVVSSLDEDGPTEDLMNSLQIEQDQFEADNPGLQKMDPKEWVDRLKNLIKNSAGVDPLKKP